MRLTTASEMIAREASVVPIEQLEAVLAVLKELAPPAEEGLAWRQPTRRLPQEDERPTERRRRP